jgi:hypothetical protein
MNAVALLLPALLATAAPPAPEPPAETGAAADPCTGPAETRAPDPRCNDGLDGREPPPLTPPLTVPRLLLKGPQLLSRALFWPVVHTSGFMESYRVLDWMKAILTSDDGRLGVRPELHYTSGFMPTAGARAFYRPPGAALTTRLLTAGPSTFRGELAVRGPDWLGLEARVSWNRRPDRLYAGLGARRDGDLAAAGQGLGRYAADALSAEADWARELVPALQLDLAGDLVRRRFSTDGVRGTALDAYYDPATIPGFVSGDRLAHLRAGLAYQLGAENRDGRALRLATGASYGRGLSGDPSRHLRLDGESVLALGGRDRAVLLRLQGSMVEPLGPAPVSFEELAAPAGSAGLRGLPDGRLRGPSAVVGSIEYRWFVAFNLDAALFVDVGTVAGERFAGLRDGPLFPSIGLGLRRFDSDPVYWRAALEDGLQVAYSPDAGWRVLLSTAAF